ncbi:MAG: site-specific integrase [Candidatus Solibacter usitatus]|nr:site-specific integrase [Candidatus Solibacter usitatus]
MKSYRIERKGKLYWAMEIPAQYLAAGARRQTVMATTREKVEERWMSRVGECRRGLDTKAGRLTVGEFLKVFLAQCQEGDGIEPSTFEDYRYHITQHIEPVLGLLPLNRLTVQEVDRLLQTLRKKTSTRTGKPLSSRTIRYAYAVLRSALQLAVDYNYISANPASARSRKSRIRLKSGAVPIRCFTPEQAQRFLRSVQGDRYEALYVLGITTGLRKGELLGLKWRDLQLATARLTVNHSLQFTRRRKGEAGPRWLLKGPKTASSRRTIELPAVAVEGLQRHQDVQAQQKALAGEDWQDLGFVFTSGRGTPLDTGNALHRFQSICAEADLPKIRFYDLRHTHASLLIHEGVHPKKIAERLGHSSIKLTMDTYGHLFNGSDRESAERMDRLFGREANREETGEPDDSSPKPKAKLLVMPHRRTG